MKSEWLDAITAIAVLVVMVMTKWDAIRSAKNLAVVHSLVNSSMLEQKKLTWMALKRVAEFSNTEADIKIAMEAEKIYRDHARQQQKMDAVK